MRRAPGKAGRVPALLAAGAMLMLITGLAACGEEGGKRSFDLTIGELVPLTGDQADLGPAGRKAGKLARNEIRSAIRALGVRHGVSLKQRDNSSKGEVTISASNMLIDQGAECVVGPWATSDTLSAATVLLPKGIPIVSPASSSDVLSGYKDTGFVSRTVLPDRQQGPALAELMDAELGRVKGKTVNIAAYLSIYGNNLIKSFEKAWTGKGGRIGRTVRYDADEQNFKAKAGELVTGKPDAFVFFDLPATFLKLAPELEKTGRWSAKKSFVTDGLATPNLITLDFTAGIRGVAPGAQRKGAAARKFSELYVKDSPVRRQSFDAHTFDAVILCYLAAVAAGSGEGRQLVAEIPGVSAPPGKKFDWTELPAAIRALQSGDEIDYDGASGPIDMRANGDPTAGFYDVFTFADRDLVVSGEVAVAGGRARGYRKLRTPERTRSALPRVPTPENLSPPRAPSVGGSEPKT